MRAGEFQGELHQTTGATFADPFHFTCNSTSPDFNLIFVMFHLVLEPIQCHFFSFFHLVLIVVGSEARQLKLVAEMN